MAVWQAGVSLTPHGALARTCAGAMFVPPLQQWWQCTLPVGCMGCCVRLAVYQPQHRVCSPGGPVESILAASWLKVSWADGALLLQVWLCRPQGVVKAIKWLDAVVWVIPYVMLCVAAGAGQLS